MALLTPREAVELGLSALGSGREHAVVASVEKAARRTGQDALLWQVTGLLHRALQQMRPAVDALARAAKLAPADAKIAHGLAHVRMEAGLPAAEYFRRAAALAPANLDIAQGLAAATLAEQGAKDAMALVEPMVAANPDWFAGHWLLSRLRGANGQAERIDESIAAAVAAQPANLARWSHWIFTLMKSERHERAVDVIGRAIRAVPAAVPALTLLEAACRSELRDLDGAEALYARQQRPSDLGSLQYWLRHQLRMGRPERVDRRAAETRDPGAEMALFPYYSLAWRMMSSPRLDWLEPPELVGVYDLPELQPFLGKLANRLRALHNQQDQPIEQSVRGGTQTDGPLLSRLEPEIHALRKIIAAAVRRHVATLPPPDPAHPQLSLARDRPLLFSGSWSVRLRGGGCHAQHVHPEGWFSSALYIVLPEPADDGDRAGWLSLGNAEPSLGLDLDPVRLVEPKPGRLVLFPSTMWHGTLPFAQGERLTVAFDVARPPAGEAPTGSA